MVSPRCAPTPASPAPSAFTRSAYSRQVQLNSSRLVRIATRFGCAAAVAWKAAHAVPASSATGRSVLLETVSTSIPPGSLPCPVAAGDEVLAHARLYRRLKPGPVSL